MPSSRRHIQWLHQTTRSAVGPGLVSLAGCTAFTVGIDVTTQTLPEVPLADIIQGFTVPQVRRNCGVVKVMQDVKS